MVPRRRSYHSRGYGSSSEADSGALHRYRFASVDGEPKAPELRYDPRELKRLVALSFSAGELSQFAAGFAVHLDRQGPVDAGARALVRALELRGELAALVARLQEEKPLVVWPEPRAVAVPTSPASPHPSAAEAQAPAPPTSTAAPPRVAAPLVDPFLSGALEVGQPEEAPGRRLAIVAAAVFAGVALGALAMWLAFRDRPEEVLGPRSPAAMAADSLREAVAAAVRACDAEPGDSARESLREAFRRCNRPEGRASRPNLLPLPPAEPPPPRPGRMALPTRPPDRGSPAQACLDACHAQHEACRKSKCGAEPTSAAEYPRYQQCLGECMGPHARCRLSCR